jgi:hypothetical protein
MEYMYHIQAYMHSLSRVYGTVASSYRRPQTWDIQLYIDELLMWFDSETESAWLARVLICLVNDDDDSGKSNVSYKSLNNFASSASGFPSELVTRCSQCTWHRQTYSLLIFFQRENRSYYYNRTSPGAN